VPAESGFRLLPDLLDESVRWMHVDHILAVIKTRNRDLHPFYLLYAQNNAMFVLFFKTIV